MWGPAQASSYPHCLDLHKNCANVEQTASKCETSSAVQLSLQLSQSA